MLYHEIYGDRIQLFHLLTCYYRALSQHSSTLLNESKSLLTLYKPVVLSGDNYNELLILIDNAFKKAIESTFTEFCSINKPLLSNTEINHLIKEYQRLLPNHYKTMKKMMLFDKKENQSRMKHLTLINHYNKMLFHQFLGQSRIINSHNCIHYAIVSAASCYGRGISTKSLLHSTHSGISSNINTMLNKVNLLNRNMNEKISSILKPMKYFVAALDNNQRGHNVKFQRGGSSNAFVKVTGRFFKSCTSFDYVNQQNEEENESKKVKITYINK
jgi:hypothetical protein